MAENTTEAVDVCPTPPELALAICRRVYTRQCSIATPTGNAAPMILEPSAGNGAFVRAARAVWPGSRIIAVEPREVCKAPLAELAQLHSCTLEEYVRWASAHGELNDFDLVIGNPPFSLAEEHIRLLLNSMRPGAVLAFLLRVGFFEARKTTRGQPLEQRLAFWRAYPEESFAPIFPRPGFVPNAKGRLATDSQSYALFTWIVGQPGRRLRDDHLVWDKPVVPRARKRAIDAAPMADAEEGESSTLEHPQVDDVPVLE